MLLVMQVMTETRAWIPAPSLWGCTVLSGPFLSAPWFPAPGQQDRVARRFFAEPPAHCRVQVPVWEDREIRWMESALESIWAKPGKPTRGLVGVQLLSPRLAPGMSRPELRPLPHAHPRVPRGEVPAEWGAPELPSSGQCPGHQLCPGCPGCWLAHRQASGHRECKFHICIVDVPGPSGC